MSYNSFGKIFRITTWGESHGKALGVVIDGCPAGLEIDESIINSELTLRQGGKTSYTTPRKEPDIAEIYSGIFEGKTTGAPISIIIENKAFDSSKYDTVKDLIKPGHANYTYLKKYGLFDHRGSGRSSARETVCRVAAGAVAKKLLERANIKLCAYLHQVGNISSSINLETHIQEIKTKRNQSPIFCPDPTASKSMMNLIETSLNDNDSIGGIVRLISSPLPVGLGEPLYYKFEAILASAMMSIPASKGFEIGSGFAAASFKGSQHNDIPTVDEDNNVTFNSNNSGGVLGGISNGMPLDVKVAFKPTSSIKKPQGTLDHNLSKQVFNLPKGSKHDPCVAIRAVPIVESMAAIVLADLMLCMGHSKIDS